MVILIILAIFVYICIGSALGGLYYYLHYRSDGYDLCDMDYLPIWIAIFWPVVAPIAFAIYYAKHLADNADKNK